MARVDTLTNFLTDVADAIREKKGTTGTIQASSFDTEIASITGGGSSVKINNAAYLFYQGNRIGQQSEILGICENVSSCKSMYQSCQTLYAINSFNLDTSNVTNMESMFQDCQRLNSINLSNFDTSKVTTMRYMFNTCRGLKSLDLSSFDTSLVTNMDSMFYYCYGLTSIDVSNFNTSNVTTMAYMFSNCNKLTSIDLSSFDTTAVTSNSTMLRNCTSLTTLIINRQDVFKMTNTNMLQDTPIEDGTGYVYVPDNMVATYKSATNWSTYADQIKGMSELPTGDE